MLMIVRFLNSDLLNPCTDFNSFLCMNSFVRLGKGSFGKVSNWFVSNSIIVSYGHNEFYKFDTSFKLFSLKRKNFSSGNLI
jgi:hypothetical protein